MKTSEDGKVYANVDERENILKFPIMMTLLRDANRELEKRAKAENNGLWRDMRMMQSASERIFERLLETLPTEQMVWIQKQLRGCTLTTGVKNVVAFNSDRQYGLWISYDDLCALLNGVHEKCMMCTLRGKGAKNCGIRKVLDLIGTNVHHEIGECGYQNADTFITRE